MAKAILKTTVKMTSSNTRVALAIKYVNGETLKISSSISRASLSCDRPDGFDEKFGKLDLAALFKVVGATSGKESPMTQFERFARYFETTTSIQDSIDNIANITKA